MLSICQWAEGLGPCPGVAKRDGKLAEQGLFHTVEREGLLPWLRRLIHLIWSPRPCEIGSEQRVFWVPSQVTSSNGQDLIHQLKTRCA